MDGWMYFYISIFIYLFIYVCDKEDGGKRRMIGMRQFLTDVAPGQCLVLSVVA
jgi:hypothetical protein